MAEEELRAQQHRLDALLAERSDPRAWRRGLISSLPVPALVSDPAGTVLELNAPPGRCSAAAGTRSSTARSSTSSTSAPPPGSRRSWPRWWPARAPGTCGCRWPATTAPARRSTWSSAPTARTPGRAAGHVGGGRPRCRARTAVTGLRTAEALAEMCRLPLASGADTRSVLARAAHLVREGASPPRRRSGSPWDRPASRRCRPRTTASRRPWTAPSCGRARARASAAYETGRPRGLRGPGDRPALAAAGAPRGAARVRSVLGCPRSRAQQEVACAPVRASRHRARPPAARAGAGAPG